MASPVTTLPILHDCTLQCLVVLVAILFPGVRPKNNIQALHYHMHENLSCTWSPPAVQSRKLDCAWICSVMSKCKCFSYNRRNKHCHLMDEMSVPSAMIDSERIQYCTLQEGSVKDQHKSANKVKEGGNPTLDVKWKGHRCTTNKSCTAEHTACYSGTCQCIVGLHYNPKTNRCVKDCHKYGTTMTVYEDRSTDGYNDQVIGNVNITGCEMKCISSKEFICKSFDFGKPVVFFPDVCSLSKNGYLDIPQKYRENKPHWKFGSRDCRP